MAAKGNLIVGQSGGPTAVINQSLVGVVLAAKAQKKIGKIYGALNGVDGILSERFVDLGKESVANLELVAATPSSALGSCRHKPTKEECEKVFEIFKKYDVRYFFYIGGNDSAETTDIINSIARERNYELCVFHVPKTIDNDLRETDHCPGFASAAKYVAQSFIGNDLDNTALPGIKIDVVMGRNAGWLTAAAALARDPKDKNSGPHLIYVPERPVTMEEFTSQILAVYQEQGRCLVACSEGITDKNTGKPFADALIDEVDSHGNKQLSGSGALGDYLVSKVKAAYVGAKKLRIRSDTLGYAQRCFAGLVSEADAKEARTAGMKAVQFACGKFVDGSVSIKRKKGATYGVEYVRTELNLVAKVTRPMNDEFLADNGHDVTPKFVKYLSPIVGKLPKVGKLNKTIIKR